MLLTAVIQGVSEGSRPPILAGGGGTLWRMDEERNTSNDAAEPSQPSNDIPEERAIDFSEGRKGMVVLPTEMAEPGDLQSVIDQVSPAPPPASADGGEGASAEG